MRKAVESSRSESYPSDLSEAEWSIIKPLLPEADYSRGGRPAEYSQKDVIDGILYIVRSGCSWRMLPKDFPPYMTVYTYFSRWRNDGTWSRMHFALASQCREALGKSDEPSAAILDSQTIKSSDHSGEKRYDAGKKTKGRKRHILVDTLGLILICVVHSADVQDRDGAKIVLDELEYSRPRLELIWADGGYAGELVDWVYELRDSPHEIDVEIVKRSDNTAGFKVLPHRWIVERTFGWLMKARRLVRDYETRLDSAVAMVHLGMIRIMTKRLINL